VECGGSPPLSKGVINSPRSSNVLLLLWPTQFSFLPTAVLKHRTPHAPRYLYPLKYRRGVVAAWCCDWSRSGQKKAGRNGLPLQKKFV